VPLFSPVLVFTPQGESLLQSLSLCLFSQELVSRLKANLFFNLSLMTVPLSGLVWSGLVWQLVHVNEW
jgi:hypothetical protein